MNSFRLTIVLACLFLAAPSARALDLETALRQVAERNPALAASDARVHAARARVPRAGAWSAPMAEVGVVNVPTSGRFDQDPMTMKMVGLSQRIPVFGANGLAKRSAEAALRSERAGSARVRNDVLAAGLVAYADAHYAAQVVLHAQAHQAEMNRLVESARTRYQSGRGRLDDVLRAESERARTLVDLASLRAEERVARNRLDALRGMPLGLPDEPLAPPLLKPIAGDAESWIAAVNDSSPRLGELAAERDRYQWAAKSARRMRWPDLEVKGSYGFRGAIDASTAHGTVYDPDQDDMFSATVGFMLPIFSGSREGAEAGEMEAMARAADAERHAAGLDLAAEVAAAHAGARAADQGARLLADTEIGRAHV